MTKDKIKLELREDGVYVLLDNSESRQQRQDLLKLIEEYRIDQVDFNAVNEVLKSEESYAEAKISSTTTVAMKNESIIIEISKDRMSASVTFFPPEFGGNYLDTTEIIEELKKAGVVFGINEELITNLVKGKEHKGYTKNYTLAQGKDPIDGDDGQIQYHVNISSDQNMPKILADGTVDYKQIDYFVSVKAGAILAERTDPTEGESGTDIYGRPVSQKPGKLAPKFSKGKNLFLSDDEKELIAQVSGQLVTNGNSMSISPVLDIKGDIGYETGNINFEGSVNIAGSVISGFSVEAAGNIEVKGVVEAASLKANGSINLFGGIQGRFKGRIEAGGSVFTKFAQNARIIADGDVVSNALLHCNVTCKGAVLLDGDNCFIAGGTVVAGTEIRAKTIGSYMGTRTEVTVGGNPELAGRYEQVKQEYEELKQKYKKLNSDYETIVKSGDVTKLDVKHKSLLLSLINNRNSTKEQALKMENELTELINALRKAKGQIIAEKVMHHGVAVTISNAALNLHDDITASVFRNINGQIKAEPNTGLY